jgi:small-conductance mechanosensitive channel
VVVRGLDQVEAIIPNETLVTSTVLNHSYTNRDVRVPVAISVAYGTDLDAALELLCETARAHPRVIKEEARAPVAMVKGFADSGIDLELGVWVRDAEQGTGMLRSDLNRAIWKAFVERGIAIPFPQREVRVLNPPGADPASPPPGPSPAAPSPRGDPAGPPTGASPAR